MLREFWESAPTSYKIVVALAMTLLAAGLLLNIIANVNHDQALAKGSLPIIGAGMLLHVVGLVVRGQAIRKRMKDK